MDSLVYGVFNVQNRLLLLRAYELEQAGEDGREGRFRDLFWREDLFQYKYAERRLAVTTLRHCLVPARLWTPEAAPAGLQALTELPAEEEVLSVPLSGLGAQMAFSLDGGLLAFVRQAAPDIRILDAGAGFLAAARQGMDALGSHQVFACIRDRVLHVAAFHNTNLLLYNTYPFQTSPDALYFLLLVYDQLNLNPEETPLNLAGPVLPESELYRLFYRFVRQIRFAPPPSGLLLPEAFPEENLHFHFDLMGTALL